MATGNTNPTTKHTYSSDEMEFLRKLGQITPSQREEMIVLLRLLAEGDPEIMDTAEREERGELTEIEACELRQQICRRHIEQAEGQ